MMPTYFFYTLIKVPLGDSAIFISQRYFFCYEDAPANQNYKVITNLRAYKVVFLYGYRARLNSSMATVPSLPMTEIS